MSFLRKTTPSNLICVSQDQVPVSTTSLFALGLVFRIVFDLRVTLVLETVASRKLGLLKPFGDHKVPRSSHVGVSATD